MDSDFEIGKGEMTGFGLCGYRQVNGTVQMYGFYGRGRFIADWPKEIRFHGCTYTLETVTKGKVNEESGEQWENAEYV